MAEDQLRTVIDGIRSRLHAELEAHLGGLAQTHEQAVVEARRLAEVDAEQRWTAKLADVSGEWNTRLQSEVAAARADVERTLIAEALRVRQEAEQSAAELATQARRELEEAVAAGGHEVVGRIVDRSCARAVGSIQGADGIAILADRVTC